MEETLCGGHKPKLKRTKDRETQRGREGKANKAAPQTSKTAAFETVGTPSKAFHGVREKAGGF